MNLDSKDRKLLELLQKDGRMQLKKLATEIGLSIDSTKKRLNKLVASGIIGKFGIFIDPKALGYDIVAGVQIKLNNISEEEHKKFIDFLVRSPHTIEVISVLGSYDIICVFIAKKTVDLEKISRNVRHEFRDIIANWESVINLKVHKFEEYSLRESHQPVKKAK